ncbi:MAG: hypothetical protein V4737_08775 [Curtobacterium sp.]
MTEAATTTVTIPTHWFLVRPCGCIDGSALGGLRHPTAEAAHKLLTPRQRDRDRETKQGWTVRGATREELDKLLELFTTPCPHKTDVTSGERRGKEQS